MRTLIILLILLIIPSFVAAQIIHGFERAITPIETPIYTDVCLVPILPNTIAPEQVVWTRPNYKIAFCIDTEGVTAITYKYTINVDAIPGVDLGINCFKTTVPALCLSVLPIEIVTPLQNDTHHTINITVRDTTNIVIGSMALPVRKPVCNARILQPFPQVITSVLVDQQFSMGSPLPASVPGALRNQQGSFTFETQVGVLRDAGWHIEWQRAQFGLDNNGLNGYWYMLGWCKGK